MTTIVRSAGGITIVFDHGIEVILAVGDGRYLGIEGAAIDGRRFLVRGRGSLPYFQTPEGVSYERFDLREAVEEAGAVRVATHAVGRALPIAADPDMFLFPQLAPPAGEMRDELDLVLSPCQDEVQGETWRGFTIAYEFRSRSRRIHWLLDSVAMAPDGTIDGATVLGMHMTTTQGGLEEVLSPASTFSTADHHDRCCIQSPARGGGSQVFDLIQGREMAVATWFARPDALKANLQKASGEDFLVASDFHYQALSGHFASQPRRILARPTGREPRSARINRWTDWHDRSGAAWREALGIRRTATRPILALEGTGAGDIDPGYTYPDLLTTWAQRLEWVAEQGFGGIILHTPEWESAANRRTKVFGGNNCCPFRFRLSDFLGGEEGLRAFCDAAHARGIAVYGWIAGHLAAEAPVLRTHPEWMVRNRGNIVWDGHYRGIQSLSFLNGGLEWMLADLRRVRAATGMDGVWFDSFANLTIQAINHQLPGREPNAPAVLRFLGELSALGYELHFECPTQLGVASWGGPSPEAMRGHEEMLYGSAMRIRLDAYSAHPERYTEELYFRSLAARAPLAVWLDEYLDRRTPFPLALPPWYARLTRAYGAVAGGMERRVVLDGGRGVLWEDGHGAPSAFFPYLRQPTPWPVLDAMDPAASVVREAQPGRIYRVMH